MTIEILPPQLANQIAAGEVVERPASVVKELVENCLDAGATRVDIEIEKGGSKLIRIKDNGSGIAKEELALALSRHATSKLHHLDDLDAIMSFGFRGEALASISSVARLTLISRTAEQTEAWLAYAEGSQMAVKVEPAAHPVGTSIEVNDLFFNTPARRRFLKSDKTEFSHIDEWLKRIALVRGEIHFTLKHNGKQIRQYRPATTSAQYLQRLAQVCGKSFAEQALVISCEHNSLTLKGYIQSPWETAATDTHYFYVNGRLVRDKLVSHAVKQAFAGLTEQNQPSYVLMLELDPHQVDVNVHPAKHEVRFHEARYIHDYILQALSSAINEASNLSSQANINLQLSQPSYSHNVSAPVNSAQSTIETPLFKSNQGYTDIPRKDYSKMKTPLSATGPNNVSASAVNSYIDLLQTPEQDAVTVSTTVKPMPPLLDGDYWVLVDDDSLSLLNVKVAAKLYREYEIAQKLKSGLVAQPLLMPVVIDKEPHWQQLISENELRLKQLGLVLTIRGEQLIIKKVPPYIRDTQLVEIIPELLTFFQESELTDKKIAQWLAKKSLLGFVSAPVIWDGIALLDEETQQVIFKQSQSLPWQTCLKGQ